MESAETRWLFVTLYITNLAKLFCHQRLNRLKDYFFHVLHSILEMQNKSALAFENDKLALQIFNPKLWFIDFSLSSGVTGFYFPLIFVAQVINRAVTFSQKVFCEMGL